MNAMTPSCGLASMWPIFFFFKQKTAYEMLPYWSSDVCSSDLTTARVWNANTGEPIILLNSHADQVNVLALSPDGRLLACGDSADSIHVWDPANWKTIHVLQIGRASCREGV